MKLYTDVHALALDGVSCTLSYPDHLHVGQGLMVQGQTQHRTYVSMKAGVGAFTSL